MVKVEIAENGSIKMLTRQISKSAYMPDAATEVIHVSSFDINKKYSANELMEVLAYP